MVIYKPLFEKREKEKKWKWTKIHSENPSSGLMYVNHRFFSLSSCKSCRISLSLCLTYLGSWTLRIVDNLFYNFLLADPLYTSHVLGLLLFCPFSMNLITCEAAQAVLCWAFRVKYMIVCSLLYSVFNMSIVNWLIQDVLCAEESPPHPLSFPCLLLITHFSDSKAYLLYILILLVYIHRCLFSSSWFCNAENHVFPSSVFHIVLVTY